MIIAIDGSPFQTPSAKRGVGRYALNLLNATFTQNSDSILYIFLFHQRLEVHSSIIELISKYPNVTCHFWEPIGVYDFASEFISDDDLIKNREINRILYSATLKSLNVNKVLILNIFEGFYSNTLSFGKTCDDKIETFVLVLDLLQVSSLNLTLSTLPGHAKFIRSAYNELRGGNFLIPISLSVRNELLEEGIAPGRLIAPLKGGVGHFSRTLPIIAQDDEKKLHLTAIINSENRKNLQVILQALEADRLRQLKIQLVLFGNFNSTIHHSLKRIHQNTNHKVELRTDASDADIRKHLHECDPILVAPSFAEGLDLPILEALSSGIRILASDIPVHLEVLGNEFVGLFDPVNFEDLADLIFLASSDKDFSRILGDELSELLDAFDWSSAGKRLAALWKEDSRDGKPTLTNHGKTNSGRPYRLAVVSPMPPLATGIADYSENQIRALLKNDFAVVDIVTADLSLNYPVDPRLNLISTETFKIRYEDYDCVLYHLGNSPFHDYQLGLLIDFPGIVFVHDASFLSWFEHHFHKGNLGAENFQRLLAEELGFFGVKRYYQRENVSSDFFAFFILKFSKNIVVHNLDAKHIVEKATQGFFKNITVIPLMKEINRFETDRQTVRRDFGFSDDDILVMSFGMIAETKMNFEILEAFLGLSLDIEKTNLKLIFVGEMDGGIYGEALVARAKNNKNVLFTRRVSKEQYNAYLQAADVAVQLRKNFKGESSGALLDTLAAGIPTIVNQYGTTNLDKEVPTIKIDECFTINDLSIAIKSLVFDKEKRDIVASSSRAYVELYHGVMHPIADLIEKSMNTGKTIFEEQRDLMKELLEMTDTLENQTLRDQIYPDLGRRVTLTLPARSKKPKIFVDLTSLVKSNSISGIERVGLETLENLALVSNDNFDVIPIQYSPQNGCYITAFQWSLLHTVDSPRIDFMDFKIQLQRNDILLIMDFSGQILPEAYSTRGDLFLALENSNVRVITFIHDVLPITNPAYFPSFVVDNFNKWFNFVFKISDEFVTSTKVLADQLQEIFQTLNRSKTVEIARFGSVFESDHIRGLIPRPKDPRRSLRILMVGTVEPRKAHLEVLRVVEELLEDGIQIELKLIGKEGWVGVPTSERSIVEETTRGYRESKFYSKQIFWEQKASDADLMEAYLSADCLLQASYAEGFGLPILEAMSLGLPVVARDVPVFREICSDSAHYFSNEKELKELIREFASQGFVGAKSQVQSKNTWKDFAETIYRIALAERLKG